jgi:hypothetical protein
MALKNGDGAQGAMIRTVAASQRAWCGLFLKPDPRPF